MNPVDVVLQHVGLVKRVAYRFRLAFPGWSLEDLEQEGMIAAVRAVKDHDPSLGASVPTLIHKYVHQRMLNILKTERRTMRDRRRELSGDQAVTEDGDTTLLDVVAIVEAAQEERLANAQECAIMARVFATLNPSYRVLLRRRFVDGATLTEVAEERGCSREWVRLEQVRALALLRARYDKSA